MKKKFVLPKKWCVQCTEETAESIYQWLDEHKEISNTTVYFPKLQLADKKMKVHYPPYKTNHQFDTVKPGYTEITYDQFKKYVLNKQQQDYSYLIKLFEQWNIK